MIDQIIMWLGQFPKEKRNSILKFIDIASWALLVLDLIFDIPKFWTAINIAVCIIMICVSIRLMMIGGWWWTDDED